MSHVLTMRQGANPAAREKPWHSVRMSVSELVRRLETVQSIAGGCGYNLRVLNNGQHWEFKRDGSTVEWWPSTGRFMVNKKGDRWACLHTLNDLRTTLSRAATP